MATDNAIKQLIRDEFPFPISHAYTYLESRVDPEDKYAALMACFEVVLKTITSIAVANFTHDIQEDSSLGNDKLFQDLLETLSRPLSLGHWHHLLRRTLRPYEKRSERLVVPELFDFYYRVTDHGNVKSQGQNVQTIDRFIQERNEEAHHRNRSQASTFQRQSMLGELSADLDTLLRELEFLADYELLYVEHAEHHSGTWHYQANFACGNSYPFRQQTWKTTLGINSGRCVLVDRAGQTVLELDPFVIVTSEGRLQQPDIFFFDGVFSSGRANFMNYHIGDYIDPTDEGSPASVASDSIKSILRLLENRIRPAADDVEAKEDLLTEADIYRKAAEWALEHGDLQSVSLDALRRILNLSREEALQEEQALDAERGIEVDSETEVPFEGEPTWANLAYYVLNTSGQEEMFYKDIAAEAEELKHQHDPNWQKGDSANVAVTISTVVSQDPRFYKLRQGYYRLTKNNELLSNPSWANLACFVLRRHDPNGRGMYLGDITDRAADLKEKYSDWSSDSAQTPRATVSASMSMDHRFESMDKRGYWRLVDEPEEPEPEPAAEPEPSTRDQAYEAVLSRLGRFGDVQPLPFGRTYYTLENRAHFMFRFSKAHQREGEVEYFLGVTPQYFERIRGLGNGFLVFVLGAADNVLLVPADDFAEWVEGVEPSGSGTWPVAFYQSPSGGRVERWVAGEPRQDVTRYLNDYTPLREALSSSTRPAPKKHKGPIRVPDLLEAGLLRPGDVVHTKKRPDLRATIIGPDLVKYRGRRWSYNDWGKHVTGWKSLNIYEQLVLERTGETLDELRKKLR